jgi:hypothetical protein
MGVNAHSYCRLISGNQRVSWNDCDVPGCDWHIVARRDEVLGADMAIPEYDTW